ncbi:MAG: ABC transporter substrate-binding protein, partial [Clostridia bacterium]|nr:ABC transporter substrate-binding protein [Clostridia bacterium]
EQFKGNIVFKTPDAEQVNMNFLVMLTSEEWSGKLAEAYKNLYGKEIELGEYENAGYKWIAEFLANCVFGNSDTTLAEELSQETAAGKAGLFVLSKLRSSSVYTENLTVGQYEAAKNGTIIEPFSGFMYPMYAMVTANSSRPYTAMLFIEYLMGADGFKPWGKSIGAYSSNTELLPLEGDLGLDAWKASLVMEDHEYILENYEDVYSFVTLHIQ